MIDLTPTTGVKNRKGSELSALIGVNLRLIRIFVSLLFAS